MSTSSRRRRSSAKDRHPPPPPDAPKPAPADLESDWNQAAASPEATSRERVLASAAAFIGAMLFILAGPYSNFASPAFIDPWLYTGYFSNFSYLLRHYGVTYYVSRLPWIIPGWLVFRVAPPHLASILLNAVLLGTSALALYWTIRWYYGRLPALAACLSLPTNLYFFNSVSWDYPDGPAIAYAFGGVAFSVRPGGRRSVNVALAGVLFALAGYTNMAVAPVILGGVLLGAWRYLRSIRGLFRYALWLGAGVVCTTLALCLISLPVLGRFDFYQPQIDQTHYAIAHPTYLSDMWGTGNAFLLEAYRLFPPVFLLLAGGVLVVRRKNNRFLLPSYLFLLVSALLFALQEFVFHGVALRVAYVSTYIVVPEFILAGAMIGELWKRPDARWLPGWALGACAAFTLGQPYLRLAWKPAGHLWIVLAVTGAAAICLLVWRGHRPLIPSLLMILVLFWGPGFDHALADPLSRKNAATFDSMIAAQNLLKGAIPSGRKARFWYDTNEPASTLFNGISALYLWGYYDLTKQTLTADPAILRYYISPQTVHLTMDPAKIPDRLRMLEARGIRVANERRWQLQGGGHTYYVVLDDVADMSGFH
jgi:hypothetical protein